LEESRRLLAAEFDDAVELNLADVAFTLGRRRRENIRMAAVVGDGRQAAAVLAAAEHDNIFVGESLPVGEPGCGRVVFLFPGQGAQHVGMARGLYESEPLFARYFDQCATGFNEELGIDLRAEVFDGTGRNLERTDRAQPALFAVGYALAKLMESYGVRPAALAGHSIGEYAAATIAGVFDLPTAVAVVSMRARLMHAAPRGVMVAVALGPEAVAEYLSDGVDVAAVNDPGGCVVAGSVEAVAEFEGRLAGRGVVARRVRTSHAFHSRLMDPVVGEFGAFVSRCRLGQPQIPLLSNVSGTWMSAAEATDASVWARGVRATVRFADEVGVLLADAGQVLVEVGPGGVLTASAARHPRWSSTHRGVRLMRHHAQNRSDHEVFLTGLGQLWAAGVEVDWTPRRSGGRPRLVSLPGYPFVRQRHWVEHRSTGGWAQPVVASGGVSGGAPAVGAGGAVAAGANGKSQIEAMLARVWAACFGVNSVRRDADFFELGGDSLIAISVAMAAAHEGIEFTPQDLYENPTVAALAKTLTARYVAGGLARQSPNDAAHPSVPPNIAYFLEHGIADGGRWRVPLILRLDAGVGVEDVRAVLTAVVNHHDGLRLRLAQRAGAWEQRIGEPGETVELAVVALDEDVEPESAREHAAVAEILADQIRIQDLSSPPLVATYVRGVPEGTCYLALSVHAVMADEVSREVLLTDIFTGFGQQLAGQDIALQPVTTSWHEWSVRCAALAIHPAVVESRDFWLATVAKATLRIADPDEAGSPSTDRLVRLPSTLSLSETSEIDDARRRLGLPVDEILLAALGRTIATTIGEGVLAVDLGGPGRSVLKPDVDLRRTIGWFTTIYPVTITCATSQHTSARKLLDDVHDSVKAVPHYGIGYGLLRHVYAPTARLLAASVPADVFFSYVGAVPDLESVDYGDAAVVLDADTGLAVRETVPGMGHGVELRVYRAAGVLHLDWWYDSARVGAAVVESLAAGLAAAVVELIAELGAETPADCGGDDLSLVDLSSVQA
jgi:phthiocerol/phenolphthiocerol synthesis type-I polyketide synthase E